MSGAAQDGFELTIGTYTDGARPGRGIVHAWLSRDGRRHEIRGVTEIADPSWVLRTDDGAHVYAVSEGKGVEGRVASFADDGESVELRPLLDHPTGGVEPCYAALVGDGRFLAVANYESGSVSVYPIGRDGALGARSCLVELEGSGPHRRQAGSHAHWVAQDPQGRHVLVVDLGSDSVLAYALAEDGTLTEAARTRFRPGFGPRHPAFHPDGRHVYLVGELGFSIAACAYDPESGELSVVGELPVLHDGVQGEDLPSGIRVGADGRFLYAAVRGSDTLCTYDLTDDPAKPVHISSVPTGGSWPRDIALSPDGALLLCANQQSDVITVFALDPHRGVPSMIGTLRIPAPSSVWMRD